MKIEKIEPFGKADVYNMEVENHHNFSVNGGFIVHNCDSIRYFTAGRPTPARVEQPKPSRQYAFYTEPERSDLDIWR